MQYHVDTMLVKPLYPRPALHGSPDSGSEGSRQRGHVRVTDGQMIKTTVTDNRVGRETCRKRGKAEKAGFGGNQTNHDKIMSYGY
jgi:hypothetical protein